MKKFTSLVLALVMVCSLSTSAFAVGLAICNGCGGDYVIGVSNPTIQTVHELYGVDYIPGLNDILYDGADHENGYCSKCVDEIAQAYLASLEPGEPGEPEIPDNSTQIIYTGAAAEQYTITVPATLNPGQSGTVTAEGTWASNRSLAVTADPSVTMGNDIDTDTTVLDITFPGIKQAGDNEASISVSESISVSDMPTVLFGTWSGVFQYNVYMQDITGIDIGTDTETDAVVLDIGETAQLSAGFKVKDVAVWESSNPNVAEVDENGLVRAKRSGHTTITVTSGGFTNSIPVDVLFTYDKFATKIIIEDSGKEASNELYKSDPLVWLEGEPPKEDTIPVVKEYGETTYLCDGWNENGSTIDLVSCSGNRMKIYDGTQKYAWLYIWPYNSWESPYNISYREILNGTESEISEVRYYHSNVDDKDYPYQVHEWFVQTRPLKVTEPGTKVDTVKGIEGEFPTNGVHTDGYKYVRSIQSLT